MEIDSLILDVDGTLWNSTPIVARAWTRAVREGGCEDMTVTADRLKGLFGLTMDAIADRLLPQLPAKQRYEIMDVCCAYEQRALEEDACHICYPGVIETIRELDGKVRLFIVSNCQSGYIELFLRKTGLGPYIADTECFGDTGKSKAENIRLVVERNGLQHPAYVGDTQGDCDAARKAGIPFIHAAYGFGTASQSDAELAAFEDLLKLI